MLLQTLESEVKNKTADRKSLKFFSQNNIHQGADIHKVTSFCVIKLITQFC